MTNFTARHVDGTRCGQFVLQINLGGTSKDEPRNRAGIDPESTTTPVWWIDLAAEHQEISTLTLDAPPAP